MEKVYEYLNDAIKSFAGDPADSDFQRGYLAALIEMENYFKNRELELDNDR